VAQQTFTYTSINRINSKGDVVGSYEFIDKKGSTFDLGFVRGANGTFKTFRVPGATETDAIGISDSLAIVGSTTQASLPFSLRKLTRYLKASSTLRDSLRTSVIREALKRWR
jgi:hypothetical protein